jgi:hypothetical protein
MKTKHHLRSVGWGILLCLVPVTLVAVESTPAPLSRPTGPLKVRVLVRDNNLATTAGGTNASALAPVAAGPGAKQAAPPAPPAAQAMSAMDAEKYTRTTKKSLTIDVVNLTNAGMDVTVKTTFMAKDESGKHEVVPEKTVENKVTVLPGKSGQFTTEEVNFTHTTAHREAQKPGGGGGGGGKGGTGGKGAPLAQMIPASGHAYFGYKVEVFQGNDLVGMAASETH